MAFSSIHHVRVMHIGYIPSRTEGIAAMAKEKTLEDLFHDTLKDIYYAERKILKALPKMKRAAQSEELKAAFDKHQKETEGQIERLQQVFELMGKRAQGKTCDAIEGIISEGEEIMDEGKKKDPYLADLGLIAAAHKVEHYEIASYITARNLAFQLRMPEVSRLLQMSLAEEQNSDMLLDQIGRPLSSVLGRPAAVV